MSALSITDEESDTFSELMLIKAVDRLSSFLTTKLKRSSALIIYSLLLIDDRLKLKTPQFEASVWRERERERERIL